MPLRHAHVIGRLALYGGQLVPAVVAPLGPRGLEEIALENAVGGESAAGLPSPEMGRVLLHELGETLWRSALGPCQPGAMRA